MASNGQPFNLLKSGPGILPVTVSKSFKAVWIRDNGKDKRDGTAGLGVFEDTSPSYGETPHWKSPALSATDIAQLNGRGLWEENQEGQCLLKTHYSHMCDRVLMAQNCVLEESPGEEPGETQYKIVLGKKQWFRPSWTKVRLIAPTECGRVTALRPAEDCVTGNMAGVRPWSGPAGDIEGWIGERYADFGRFCRMAQRDFHHARDSYAASLLMSVHSLSDLPAAWGLGNNPVPLASVHFDQPFEWEHTANGDVKKYGEHIEGIGFRREEDGDLDGRLRHAAQQYVLNHPPDRIGGWEAISLDQELQAKERDLVKWDSDGAMALAEYGLQPGYAFDAVFVCETWKFRVMERTNLNSPWHVKDKGLLTVGDHPYNYDTDGPLDSTTNYTVEDGKGWSYWSCAVRIVKPLPPKGGGA